mmetsp:Transcript_144969/g.263655  ORF Transcript_144969/g.263655 Transcript_144969/m.263655 type:complete len:85 (+) Transcript_144969:530-784(+)
MLTCILVRCAVDASIVVVRHLVKVSANILCSAFAVGLSPIGCVRRVLEGATAQGFAALLVRPDFSRSRLFDECVIFRQRHHVQS